MMGGTPRALPASTKRPLVRSGSSVTRTTCSPLRGSGRAAAACLWPGETWAANSSTAPSETISPAILAKRLARPWMRTNPSESRATMSPVSHRSVESDDRSRLGRAVALQNADAKEVIPQAARFVRHLLRARADQAHRVEVVRVRHARIAPQEGVGAEEHSGVGAVDELGHDPIVQRRGVQEGFDTGQNGQKRPDRQAEGVKHRQRVEDLVLSVESDAGPDLMPVCLDVPMRKHHALW